MDDKAVTYFVTWQKSSLDPIRPWRGWCLHYLHAAECWLVSCSVFFEGVDPQCWHFHDLSCLPDLTAWQKVPLELPKVSCDWAWGWVRAGIGMAAGIGDLGVGKLCDCAGLFLCWKTVHILIMALREKRLNQTGSPIWGLSKKDRCLRGLEAARPLSQNYWPFLYKYFINIFS